MKWLLAFPISTLLLGQTVIPNGAPASHVFDGRIDEWRPLAPTFELRSTTGGRKARVWVRQVAEGLLIAGEVLGDAPDFPNQESEMLQKDHVEIWLAPENPPKFPPVGWVNFEDHVTIQKRQDCIDYVKKKSPGDEASCDQWLAQVARDRPRVARLFARQFGLSPDVSVEAYARPAWEALNQVGEWAGLEPKQMPLFKAEPFDGGYGFESVVSWEAMPPFTSLDWKSMRLMVDVFSAHKGPPKNQPFSTSSAVRRYGDLATLNLVKLAAGRNFRVTGCEYPLEELELPDESNMPAFFRPTPADDVMEVMILRRSFGSRMALAPEGHSPTQVAFDYWQRPLAVGSSAVTACGPPLRVRDKNGIHPLTVEGDKDALTALEQPGGGYLVMSGPTVRPSDSKSFDPCFACTVVNLSISSLGPRGDTRTLLELNEATGIYPEALLDRDIQVSKDWSKVTIYRETSHEPSEWESETLCRQGVEYKSCGKNPHSGPPPLPRVVMPLEQH
jgi:hypothetical protein